MATDTLVGPMTDTPADTAAPVLPYRIACLCYLFDADGRALLLHRSKPPNQHLYSPIGGKLETAIGESPTTCAQREIQEEAGIHVPVDQLHLTGLVSERGFGGECHWLMFLFEATKPVAVPEGTIREGRLGWHEVPTIDTLPQPQTDRDIIWPLFWKHRGGFFAAHIDCIGPELTWELQQAIPAPRSRPAPGS